MFAISLGDLIDTVKIAAEGVKNHSSGVAAWMRNNVSPTLRNILPTSPGPPPGEPQPSTSAEVWAGRPVSKLLMLPKCKYVTVSGLLFKHVMYVFG